MLRSDSHERLRELYRDLHELAGDLREAALDYRDQRAAGHFTERGDRFSWDPDDPNDPINRSIDITREFGFLVAVTGAFSSGKSTLLNALLGAPELLPASAIPLTAVCTVIRYGKEPAARVNYVSLDEGLDRATRFLGDALSRPLSSARDVEEALEHPERFAQTVEARESLLRFARLLSRHEALCREPVSFDDRHRFICGGGVAPGAARHFMPTPAEERDYLEAGGAPSAWVTPEWLSLIRDVTLHVDSPLLRNDVAFLDLPGLNCREDYHRVAIESWCTMADCVIVTAFQPGNQADEDVVRNFKSLSANFRDKLFFVFNRIDQFHLEPAELSRSFDYLTRDCIGADFPRERCFLTSAYLSHASTRPPGDSEGGAAALESLAGAFADFSTRDASLDALVQRAVSPHDPGGVGFFRESLERFLENDAYRAKTEEVVTHLSSAAAALEDATAPHFGRVAAERSAERHVRDALRYLHDVEERGRAAVHGYRYDYLKARDGARLSEDLTPALRDVHTEIRQRIADCFDRPIRTAPPRENPVGAFDLRRIGDDASRSLQRELQELVVDRVAEHVITRLEADLAGRGFTEHAAIVLGATPELARRLEDATARFRFMARHSTLCAVRSRFHAMPPGRDLKRLERRVELGEMKRFLVDVFLDFYPDWIFQNVYPGVRDELWLSLYLDAEELERELAAVVAGARAALSTPSAALQIDLPTALQESSGGEVARLCRTIAEIQARLRALAPDPAGGADRSVEAGAA